MDKREMARELSAEIMMSTVNIPKNHQKVALEMLFPAEKDRVCILKSGVLAPDEISMIGTVHYVDDKPHFIHHTFAEYWIADFLVTQFTNETCFLLEELNILFKILLRVHYRMVRCFVDGLLVNHEKYQLKEKVGKAI
jgi:hypothetical protein